MANARITAIKALIKMESDDAYSNILIDSALKDSGLSDLDRAFASALFYGVLERKITLDHILQKYSKKPIAKTDSTVLNILRAGVYQLKFMYKVPDSAAVNESVKAATVLKKASAKGFINAVLRSFIRDDKKVTYPKSAVDRMSVEYSVEKWIAKSFISDYGEENAKGILDGFYKSTYLSLRVNTKKITADELLCKLKDDGINAKLSPICEDNIIIENSGSVERLYGFGEGLFHVQDTASQLCVKALDIKSDSRVLDVCAAPGGKSFTMAQMTDNSVISCDLYKHKASLIENGAKRLSLDNVKPIVNDAKIFNADLGSFDRVLCDLPCSGLGILGKKPEIRYKNVTIVDKLPQIQYDLLMTSKDYVNVGGLLCYSTCALRQAENKMIADKFLAENDDFEAVKVLPELKRGIDEPINQLTLMPHIHVTDGFFISLFRKRR